MPSQITQITQISLPERTNPTDLTESAKQTINFLVLRKIFFDLVDYS